MKIPDQVRKLKTPIAIVGMAKTGQSVYELLISAGFPQESLITFDDKPGAAQISDPDVLINKYKPGTLVISPGVPLSKPWIQSFVNSGGEITSELEIAFEFLTTEQLVCITGSIGKSTVTSLLGEGLRSFSASFFVGGNLGIPFADYITALLGGRRTRADWVVLELSSYQLDLFRNLKTAYSIITYFTPNHLERYGSLNDYYLSKVSLINKTFKHCIINQNSTELVAYLKGKPWPVPLEYVNAQLPELASYDLSNTQMLGKHSIENLSLATKLALSAGWPRQSINSMKLFSGLPHRLENVGTHQGIQFINDSKSTTIESSLQAFFSIYKPDSDKNLFFLLGGRDKNLPWEDLTDLKTHKNIRFVFFGECAQLAQKKSGLSGQIYASLKEALISVKDLARPGDVVLLSPGGTSLDEFKSFEDRGAFFKIEVLRLWSNSNQQE